jgi:signal transduction histidine kinase/CheY-like chemotaxis protein/HPt (histidine-containing phosphotransfer) domain-containing protein
VPGSIAIHRCPRPHEQPHVRLLRRNLSIRIQLLALFGLLLATGATVLILDEVSLREDITRFNSLRDESLTGLRLAKSISDAYGLDIVDTTFRVRNYLMGWDQGVSVVDTAQSDIKRDWESLIASNLSPEQRALTDEVAKARVNADNAATKLRSILKAQDIAALGKFADTELYPAMDPVTTRLQFLADVKMLDADRSVREHLMRASQLGWWRIGLSLAALIFVVVVGRDILRNVYKGVEGLVHLARHARDPAFVAPRNLDADGELGQIHTALLAMRQDLLNYEDNLIRSEARAQAANRAKSTFLASMSHEIRTPMVGVTGMLELLAHTRLDADQRQQIEIVQNSARSLLQIIGDILDFSKIEAGKLEINPLPVDLRLFVRDCIHNFLAMASAKGLALDCSIDERVGAAHLADPLRLRQILGNFLSNAVKFSERGNVQVRLERLAVQEQRELLALRVIDTGIGISEEDQGRLFQPFAQASDGGARFQDSTGLGLSISRRLAELMGGEITLESRLGVGTTLSLILRLPLADPALIKHAAATAPAMRAAPSIAEAEREGSLILLADDHPTNRAVIKRQINQLGYACESAMDGDAALQLWKSGRFGLLLTDLHMPRRDGYALAIAVREHERQQGHSHTPIIALSATISAEGVERSRASGIDDFIAKPATLAVLANALQRYLPVQGFTADMVSAPAAASSTLDRELLADFLRSTHEDLAALAAAFARRDATAIAHEAHRIRGASLLVEADALAACAARIETAARANDLAPIQAGIIELEAEVNAFATANR